MTVLRIVVEDLRAGHFPCFELPPEYPWPIWFSGDEGEPVEWNKTGFRVTCREFEMSSLDCHNLRAQFLAKIAEFPIAARVPGTTIISLRDDASVRGPDGVVFYIHCAILFIGGKEFMGRNYPESGRMRWVPKSINDPKGMGEELKKMEAVWEVMES